MLPLMHKTTKPLWTPYDTPDVCGWWDASDESTITEVSGLCSQINDKARAGLNQHLTQSNASLRPATGTRTVNGLNVLDAGQTEFLEYLTLDISSSNSISVFSVNVIDSVASDPDSIYSMDATLGGNDWQFSADNVSQFDGELRGGGFTNVVLSGGPYSGLHLFDVEFDANADTVTTYVDGDQKGQATDYIGGIDDTMEFRWNSNRTANSGVGCAMCELVLTVGPIHINVREEIVGYLAHKWGFEANLPTTHPYRYYPPRH
jgi:hypothetical protein